MLDSFLKKESNKSSAYPRPHSPYSEMQAALSPSHASDPPKEPATQAEEVSEPVKVEAAKPLSSPESVSKLIVGPDIKLKGAEITDCDTLVVEGRVEASMDSRVIQIAENGVFVGKVGIDVAEIRGRFEGELIARKQLVIHSTGHVSGKIRYGKITVEEGGELLGDVASLNNKAATSAVTEYGKSEAANAGGAHLKAANSQH
jgi:cytoskeletal protein CcmA (bactofilin family)